MFGSGALDDCGAAFHGAGFRLPGRNDEMFPSSHEMLPSYHEMLPSYHEMLPSYHEMLPSYHEMLPSSRPGSRDPVPGTVPRRPHPRLTHSAPTQPPLPQPASTFPPQPHHGLPHPAHHPTPPPEPTLNCDHNTLFMTYDRVTTIESH